MKICDVCGSNLAGVDPHFCSNCGAPVADDPDVITFYEEDPDSSIDDDDEAVAPEFYDDLAPLQDVHRRWPAVFNSVVAKHADSWFGEPRASVAELYENLHPDLGRGLRAQASWMANLELSPSFLFYAFDAPMGAPLKPRTDAFIPMRAVDDASRIRALIAAQDVQMASMHDDEGLIGWWPTESGGSVVQIVEARRAASGEEYLYWYTTPLVSSGLLPDNDAAHIGMVSWLPAALQVAYYLAECPAPSMPELFKQTGRAQMLFGAIDDDDWAPIPMVRATPPSSENTTFLGRTPSTGLIDRYRVGARIDVGLVIPIHGSDYLVSRGIEVAVNTAIRLAEIIEDGYLNHQDGEVAFDRMLMSQTAWVEGEAQFWFPTSRLQDLDA